MMCPKAQKFVLKTNVSPVRQKVNLCPLLRIQELKEIRSVNMSEEAIILAIENEKMLRNTLKSNRGIINISGAILTPWFKS